MKSVETIVYGYKTDSIYGFTSIELGLMLIEHFPTIEMKRFWEKFGINTCAIIDGITRYYPCDVELTIRLCLENREMKAHEWD